MSANLEAKKLIVEEIKNKIQSSISLTFVDYRGLTVEEDVQLYDYDVSFLLRTSSDVADDVYYSVWTDTLGRQLTTQYPDKETVLRCAIMKQFTDSEMKKLNDMWDEVKVSAIPNWLMILIVAVILLAIIGIPTYTHLNKRGVRIILKRKNKNLTLVKREILKQELV